MTVEPPVPPRIAALVLAAGQSRRMGTNKLLVDLDGVPLIARMVDAVLASAASPVLVVTGHQSEALRAALAGRDVTFVANPDYAQGLSTSLRAGIAALSDDVEGAVVCLGDMPAVGTEVIAALIAGFEPAAGAEIIAPGHAGERGNPVLWGRRFFPALENLSGDRGGKPLFEAHPGACRIIAVDEPGVLLDIDTPEALTRYRRGTMRQDR